MTVNREKTQVVIFRKGHQVTGRATFQYNGEDLQTVDEYRYLGFYFHAWLRPDQHGFPKLLASAQRAANWLSGRCHALGIRDLSAALRLFNMYVRPILLYACHVWLPFLDSGENNAFRLECSPLEKVQLSFMKSFLRLPQSTPTAPLLWETGVEPILPSALRIIFRYIFKTFYHWKCYRFSYPISSGISFRDCDYRFCIFERSLLEFVPTSPFFRTSADLHKDSWILKFSHLLEYFCKVKPSKCLETVSRLDFASTVYDIASTQFRSQLTSSLTRNTGTVHQYFNNVRSESPGQVPYLWSSRSFVNRDLLLRLRLSALKLDLQRQRWAGVPSAVRTSCPCCTCECVESERHFLLECPLYKSLRFNRKFRHLFHRPEGGPAMDSELSDILRTSDYDTLGHFVFVALQRRRDYLAKRQKPQEY